MWKRSEVERLTGLERHTIQDLCNKSTRHSGLGFWEPAVMKPGYSRFDEGDLLAFYLVRQLTGAGFVPARVGGLVFDMLDEGDGYLLALEGQRLRLDGQRAKINSQLAALGRLEVAASRSPEQRLEAIMESSLLVSVDQSVVIVASEWGATSTQAARTRALLADAMWDVLAMVWGREPRPSTLTASHHLKCLIDSGADPASEAARAALRDLVPVPAGGLSPDEAGLLLAAWGRLLGMPENGVPIELAFGKGSFEYLGRFVASCVSVLEG